MSTNSVKAQLIALLDETSVSEILETLEDILDDRVIDAAHGPHPHYPKDIGRERAAVRHAIVEIDQEHILGWR